jgi:hypothetical protein
MFTRLSGSLRGKAILVKKPPFALLFRLDFGEAIFRGEGKAIFDKPNIY